MTAIFVVLLALLAFGISSLLALLIVLDIYSD
jgi:hypothetical protein